ALGLRLGPGPWRFPELDAVAFGIHDPGEAAVIVVLALGVNFDAFAAELRQQSIEVVHAIVDHETGLAGVEVFGVAREEGPDGYGFALAAIKLLPAKHGA